MWIKINRDLINLDHVKFVGISVGNKGKYVLYFSQGIGRTTPNVSFEFIHEAQAALNAVEQYLDIVLRYP